MRERERHTHTHTQRMKEICWTSRNLHWWEEIYMSRNVEMLTSINLFFTTEIFRWWLSSSRWFSSSSQQKFSVEISCPEISAKIFLSSSLPLRLAQKRTEMKLLCSCPVRLISTERERERERVSKMKNKMEGFRNKREGNFGGKYWVK